jgi:hypothetical protein
MVRYCTQGISKPCGRSCIKESYNCTKTPSPDVVLVAAVEAPQSCTSCIKGKSCTCIGRDKTCHKDSYTCGGAHGCGCGDLVHSDEDDYLFAGLI